MYKRMSILKFPFRSSTNIEMPNPRKLPIFFSTAGLMKMDFLILRLMHLIA